MYKGEMATQETIPISYPMAKGDGEHSYSQNSNFQREIAEAAKVLVSSAIEDMLEFSYSSGTSNTFSIADFGCSTGSNTLIATQNIIEAVKQKYESQHPNHPPLEFQLFFNDHVNNDFNALFRNFPPSREFFAAGVPGSFYNRLFPKASLHLGHSSYALHWLSKVPDEVMDVNSPAWNKDSIHCSGLSKEVAKAYAAQFRNDMERFLNARAQEVVGGGLLLLTVAGETDGTISSQTYRSLSNDILGYCLADMAKEGLISEEKLEAFNLPIYSPTIPELEAVLQRNAYFSVERISLLIRNPMPSTSPSIIQPLSKSTRAIFQELIRQQFGDHIVDSVFERYPKKLSENLHKFKDKQETLNIFIMASKETIPMSYVMARGDGQHSYSQNSFHQREIVEAAKVFVNSAIGDVLEFNSSGTCINTFAIADFGCSTGSNTLIATQNIIEAVKHKYQSQHPNHPPLEFQVFFNDHVNNDFNTLFRSIPPSREFFASGVPGSFHERLFPKASLHLGHSSYTLHWLSKVPDEVMDVNSPAWNKDSIHCSGVSKEVAKAYAAQFQNDMERFLNARAQEVVVGGLLLLTVAAETEVPISSQSYRSLSNDILGYCLADMAEEGLVSREKVEAFNIPIYYPPVHELEAVLQRNTYISVERIRTLVPLRTLRTRSPSVVQPITKLLRAIYEELISQHFGDWILDSVFERFAKKLTENLHLYDEKHKSPNMASTRATMAVSYPMSSGEGPHSYAQNSNFQRIVVEAAKPMVKKAIEDTMELTYSSTTFTIADFGCSIGSNTLIATQNIIEAVKHKYSDSPPLDFQVFFNDHVNNDFNTLFRNLPPCREFFAAGVPGGFHSRLFPEASLHLGHSSFALHWLSKVPEEVLDVNSPAYNKDSIHCTGFAKEVAKAYAAQFQNDMESFLNSRAQELVGGGLLILTVAGLPRGTVCSQTYHGINNDVLGCCLKDMAQE
ncbi:hypothetical protein Tsubulata_033356, partial [Turnera subulata]